MKKVIRRMNVFFVPIISIILVQNIFSQSPRTVFRFSSGPDWHLNETQLYQGSNSYSFPSEKGYMLAKMNSWGSKLHFMSGDVTSGSHVS